MNSAPRSTIYMVLVVMSIVVVGCDDIASAVTSERRSEPDVQQVNNAPSVNLQDLRAEYQDNVVRAEKEYNGKLVRFSAEIETVGVTKNSDNPRTKDRPYVTVSDSNGMYRGVRGSFYFLDDEQVSLLQPERQRGQERDFVCRVVEYSSGAFLMDECIILR
jgi:hypothetical protein